LTFSKADGNDADVAQAMEQGMNVTVVFDKIPKTPKPLKNQIFE
jgi:hypothetical protein